MLRDLARGRRWDATKYLNLVGSGDFYFITLDEEINPLAIDHLACNNEQELEQSISLLEEGYCPLGSVVTNVS